jgi:hypothetical protein
MLTNVEENDPPALSAKHLRCGEAGRPATPMIATSKCDSAPMASTAVTVFGTLTGLIAKT